MQVIFEASDDHPQLFILVTQHHSDEEWSSAERQETDALSITSQVLEDVIAKYPIDPNRVYLAGISSGGTACWELAARHPNRFAAVAPISSSYANPNKADCLVGLPVWAFNSSSDTKAPAEHIRPMILAIQRTGGIAELTETAALAKIWSHDAWTAAFKEHHLLEWLLVQRRGMPGSRPVDFVPSKLSLIATWFASDGWVECVWCGVAAIFYLACFHGKRRACELKANTRSEM